MARLPLTQTTIKKLFALSGNMCAFPGCSQKMIEGDVVVGTICHIEAAEPGGQRYNPNQSDEERRSVHNLILLCPTHHKITDDIAAFPVSVLQRMKAEHEAKYQEHPLEISDQLVEHLGKHITGTVHIDGSATVYGSPTGINNGVINNTYYMPDTTHTSISASQKRIDHLEDLNRQSIARCIDRWQAVGVSRLMAVRLANDPAVGNRKSILKPHAEKPLLLLIAELGMGKSLFAERLFQEAVAEATQNPNAPIPVYLKARECVGQLQAAIDKATSDLGNVRRHGSIIVIDGADEIGIGRATDLLSEARVAVNAWHTTKIIIASRPLPSFKGVEEVVHMPPLSVKQSNAIIRKLAGRKYSGWGLPESIKDAVTRPLFAVLLGIYLRTENSGTPRSIGELLSHLVETSLGRVNADRASASQLLQRLAAMSMDRAGAFVPAVEIASKAELQPLLESRLVIEQQKTIGFPLPILAEWFAAHSLAAGLPSANDLTKDTQRLEQWFYPLVIFVSTFSHDQVSMLLPRIIEQHPILASQIVHEGIVDHSLAKDVSLPPLVECGKRLRQSMQAWADSIKPLNSLIAPTDATGSLLPLGISVKGQWIDIAWYSGKEKVDEVVNLPRNINFLSTETHDWDYIEGTQAGHQPAWFWRYSFDKLVHELSSLLQQRALPVHEGPLLQEAAWQCALALTQLENWIPSPIPLSKIEEILHKVPQDVGILRSYNKQYNLKQFRSYIENLRRSGETEIRYPWPSRDIDIDEIRNKSDKQSLYLYGQGKWSYDERYLGYSDEQLFARTKAVYTGAIESYQYLVNLWFPNFLPRLQTALILPARLEVLVNRPDTKGHYLNKYWKVLPYGNQSVVELRFRETDLTDEEVDQVLQDMRQQHHVLRPQVDKWIHPSFERTSFTDILLEAPVTHIVYKWLWGDLRRVSWVKGLLGND